jgi:type II secretory pathway pseudopilin PulG
MDKRFKAFTLVEMLIVMGIIIILMAVGITAGRYAINRANDVAHQNAVDNIYTAVQAYYSDNREFPAITDFDAALDNTAETPPDYSITEYMDEGAFDGGTETTYYYVTDSLQQEVLICVSLFGAYNSTRDGDFYCNGNGFGSTTLFGGTSVISEKVIERTSTTEQTPLGYTFNVIQNWNAGSVDGWGEVVTGAV